MMKKYNIAAKSAPAPAPAAAPVAAAVLAAPENPGVWFDLHITRFKEVGCSARGNFAMVPSGTVAILGASDYEVGDALLSYDFDREGHTPLSTALSLRIWADHTWWGKEYLKGWGAAARRKAERILNDLATPGGSDEEDYPAWVAAAKQYTLYCFPPFDLYQRILVVESDRCGFITARVDEQHPDESKPMHGGWLVLALARTQDLPSKTRQAWEMCSPLWRARALEYIRMVGFKVTPGSFLADLV